MGAPLSEQEWTKCTIIDVLRTFLRAERERAEAHIGCDLSSLLECPNPSEAELRRALNHRCPLLERIPDETTWYEIRHLQEHHLAELLVIGSPDWLSDEDRNDLLKVVLREHFGAKTEEKLQELREVLQDFDRAKFCIPILWGHGREGPFTIIDGNHRLVALIRFGLLPKSFMSVVYVGLSASHCCWHLPDPKCGECPRC